VNKINCTNRPLHDKIFHLGNGANTTKNRVFARERRTEIACQINSVTFAK